MFIDNLLPVSPVCTKLDLSPLRMGRFRGGHNLAPTTDTCPLPTLPGSPYHGCRSGPCHIAGPNQDQPLRPVTCRDQTPPQPRILQPSLACCRCLKMERNGTEWYRIRKFRPFRPPPQPRILQPSLACCRRPKMERNGTEWYRIRTCRPFLPSLQPRILQPAHLLPTPQNGTEWYKMVQNSKIPAFPPAAPAPNPPTLPHLLPTPQNGTKWYRMVQNSKIPAFPPAGCKLCPSSPLLPPCLEPPAPPA